MEHTVLVVEDEKGIREAIGIYMKNQGYHVILAKNGKEGLEKIHENDVHLAIVDIMMPVMDGITMVMEVRKKYDFPILFLSAKSEDMDKIFGLNIGADDYITKPFGMMEFIARVRAVLRRAGKEEKENDVLETGDLQIQVKQHQVLAKGEKVTLTLKEFELLKFLMENKGIVLTRDRLLGHVWGYDFDGETRTVDVHVRTLRQKLGECGELIETVRGVGYRIGG